MKKFTEVYLTRDITTGSDHAYNAGHIYSIEEHEATQYIKQGAAEAISFPTLDAIKREGDRIADSYRSNREKIKTTLRYAMNEPEREYQLEKLEEETAAAISQKNLEIRAELQALKIDIASKALDVYGTPEELAKSKATTESILTQLYIAPNPSDVFTLIELKVNTMSRADKIELLKRFDEVKAKAASRDHNVIADIEKALRTVQSDSMRTLSHINALEKAGINASLIYNVMKLAQKASEGGSRIV